MPYHDLNLLHTSNTTHLNHSLAFATELGYKTVAVASVVTGDLPRALQAPDLSTLRPAHPALKLLTRLTLNISDTSQNHRLSTLQSIYDLIALRPLNEKSLQQCCATLECDIISIDFAARLPFIIRFTTVASAIQRGVRFEIGYSAITGSSEAKRSLIAGATSLIRATRGRAIILSSEARNALGLRGPHDVMNLAHIWGLEQAKGKGALVEEADKVVRLAALRRKSYRGVITVVDGGKPVQVEKATAAEANMAASNAATLAEPGTQATRANASVTSTTITNGLKRKASSTSLNNPSTATPRPNDFEATTNSSGTNTPNDSALDEQGKPLSKREQKRRAKKARLEARGGFSRVDVRQQNGSTSSRPFPIKHETLVEPKKGPLQQQRQGASGEGGKGNGKGKGMDGGRNRPAGRGRS